MDCDGGGMVGTGGRRSYVNEMHYLLLLITSSFGSLSSDRWVQQVC